MGRRTWFKIFALPWLSGSISEESLAVQGFFVKLLALAADSNFGEPGEICVGKNVGFSGKQFSKIVKISPKTGKKFLKILLKSHRISVNNSNIITICNWSLYQSEYSRQATYRQNPDEYALAKEEKISNLKLQQKNLKSYKQKEKEKESIYKENILKEKPIRKPPNYTPGFLTFWKDNPRPENKGQALINWNHLLEEGFTEDQLIKSGENYKDWVRKTNQTFIKNASNFLGEARTFECYLEGEYKPSQQGGVDEFSPRKPELFNYTPEP